MQNEMNCLNHYFEFLHIQDIERLFWKIVGALLVYEI